MVYLSDKVRGSKATVAIAENLAINYAAGCASARRRVSRA